jgi:hypothetical protein
MFISSSALHDGIIYSSIYEMKMVSDYKLFYYLNPIQIYSEDSVTKALLIQRFDCFSC